MNAETHRSIPRSTILGMRYFIPVLFAFHAANNGWFYFLEGSDEVRLLFPLAAVVAAATLVLRRYSIEYSRYSLAFAMGIEAAARIVRHIQEPPPLNHSAAVHLALAILAPAIMLASDASLLANLSRLQKEPQETGRES